MIQALIAVCPIDDKDDKVQKATGLVSSTSEPLKARVAMPRFALNRPAFHEPSRPVAPPAPRSRLDDNELRNTLWGVGAFGGVIAVVGLILLFQGGGAAIWGLLCLVAAGGAFAGIYFFVDSERHKHEELLRKATEQHEALVKAHVAAVETARGRFEGELREWQAKLGRVQQARAKWDQDMYYCHRHDVVFLAGTDTVARPEDMPNLLGLDGIPLEPSTS